MGAKMFTGEPSAASDTHTPVCSLGRTLLPVSALCVGHQVSHLRHVAEVLANKWLLTCSNAESAAAVKQE